MRVGAGGIETLSGAMKKPKKQDGHSHGNYLIAVHRKAETTTKNCERLYAKRNDAYERTTPLTQKEVRIRNKFTAVAAAVAARRTDLSHVSADQQAFLAQKDAANGKKTLRAYLWSVCSAEYDAQNA